jgi:hypothetical protein
LAQMMRKHSALPGSASTARHDFHGHLVPFAAEQVIRQFLDNSTTWCDSQCLYTAQAF